MLLLPGVVQAQLALVKIGSPVRGRDWHCPLVGVRYCLSHHREKKVLHWFPGIVNIWHMQPTARLPVGFCLSCACF